MPRKTTQAAEPKGEQAPGKPKPARTRAAPARKSLEAKAPGLTSASASPKSKIEVPSGPPKSKIELPKSDESLLDAFRARYPFPLDPFQEEAIAYLAGGDSVMVAAPTGTGKTVVAE